MLLFTELWSSAGFVDVSLNENKELVIFLKEKNVITVSSALSSAGGSSQTQAKDLKSEARVQLMFFKNKKVLCPPLNGDDVFHKLMAET